MIVGYTASADHAGFWLYQQPPWDADVFGQANDGGALYVYHSEKFDRLTFKSLSLLKVAASRLNTLLPLTHLVRYRNGSRLILRKIKR